MLKVTLWLVILLALIYLRLLRRQRRGDRICPQCGRPNPAQREYCRACSARLVRR
jgi:hypothetical protein